MRKTRKLKPELIVRVADWNKVVFRKLASEFAADLESIPNKPGVYLFFDQSGYLYIGEAKRLRERLKQHLDESDRASLATYFKKTSFQISRLRFMRSIRSQMVKTFPRGGLMNRN